MRYDSNNMLSLWLFAFVLEALVPLLPLLWRYRRAMAILVCCFIVVTTAGLSVQLDVLPAGVLIFLAMYRLGNQIRLLAGRMNETYLRHAVLRTSIWVFIIHLVLLIGIVIPIIVTARTGIRILSLIQAVVAVIITLITIKNIRKLRFKMPEIFLSDRELPTVTVAIPARNETDDLQGCLRSVLASDYPKLEIIVLDDCSQSQTAEVIKSFAHEGVRFVRGQEPAERWLAKNQAYQKLYEESAGELILFCGVDARFGPLAIRSMVNLLYARKKSMLSVLPIRFLHSPISAFIQPMRYWWELAWPRRLFNRPAVLSTCWMIGRQDLKALGGFSAVSHSITPEAFFARELIKTDQYSFVRSSAELEVQTTKNFHEQYATAVRTHYPRLHRRPEWVLLMGVFNCMFLLLPFGLLLTHHWWPVTALWIPLCSVIFLILTHVLLVSVTDPANSLLAVFTFPLVVATEVVISYVSMIQYEFFRVDWKDRNICIPVMHVIPGLPTLTNRGSSSTGGWE